MKKMMKARITTMAILKPDTTIVTGGVPVNEYFLTKHNPNGIDMPNAKLSDVIGVTVHNTDWIKTASGTTPAEQYTRATVNGNMNDVRVHFYVDDVCAWQNLPLDLTGWHAADGSGNGNRKTIAIECIMSAEYNDRDKKSEDNAARLAAALLKRYNLGIEALFTHTHWLNVKDGKTGSVDQLNTMKNSYKNCPLYILPHWSEFKAKVAAYLEGEAPTEEKPTPQTKPDTKKLYRVRKSWADAKSQIGAYENLDNAKKACTSGYTVYDEDGKAIFTNAVKSYVKGAEITLKDTTLYASAYAEEGKKRSGTYFLYDGMVVNGRMRITNEKKNCGNTPVGYYVTGWVNKSDI